jgi:hypothetical protein
MKEAPYNHLVLEEEKQVLKLKIEKLEEKISDDKQEYDA